MLLVRRLVVVLASASMVLASFGVASAHDSVSTSSVTIKASTNGLKGTVGSGSCKKNRKVTVFKKSTGKKVKSTTTNKRGKWSISLPSAEGKYYASVKKKIGGAYDHVHVCLGDKSPTIEV